MIRALLAVCLMVVFASPAFSQMNMSMGQQRGMRQGNMEMCKMCSMAGPGDMMDDMMPNCLANAEKIGLSEEQIGKIKPIHMEMQKKGVQYRADLKIAQIDLKGIMDVKDFDLERADAQVKKIEEIRTAHHLEMLKSMKEVRSILTDEQFKKMKQMMPMKTGKAKPRKMMMKKKQQ
jgi:Spy/CpxP family protein refolding chaperone